MKGLCVETGKGDARFTFEGATPLIGRYYTLEDGTYGSNQQNKLFHSLLKCFHDDMFNKNTFMIEDNGTIYNFSTPDVHALKDYLKYQYGKGFSHVNYVDKDNQIIKANSFEECPTYVLEDFGRGNTKRVKGVLISWADYSMPQRQKLIDKVFKFMDIFGVDSGKYQEIKDGLIQIDDERKAQIKRDKEAKNERL